MSATRRQLTPSLHRLAALLFAIPLASDQGWQLLTYRGIPPNATRFHHEGLEIRVRRSASPIIYRFDHERSVRRIRARGRLEGVLNVSAHVQGQRDFDDYALRLGLVETGQRRLGVLERRFAPPWVRRLFALAPDGTGISQVRFLNLGIAAEQIGRQRRHPSSPLVHEEIVAVPASDGRFDFSVDFGSPVPIIALWISADGDDTHSTYVIVLNTIELEVDGD